MTAAIGAREDVAARLAAALGETESAVRGEDAAGTVCVDVPAQRWLDAARWLRDELALDYFDWLSAVDEPGADPASVDVVLHVVQSRSGGEGIGASAGLVRMLLRTRVPASAPVLASVTPVWAGAAWHERETHEMFGVGFEGFDDGTGRGLRPLLLPDGFEGTPLRKSFVLAARASKPWPGAKEPGESHQPAEGSPSRRKLLPAGVPDATWGPRPPASPDREAAEPAEPDGSGDDDG